MYIWRKRYPRVVYQPVIAIHGVFYVVKDEVIFKRHLCEWILPEVVARHVKYNPRNLPVPRTVDTGEHYFLILALRGQYPFTS